MDGEWWCKMPNRRSVNANGDVLTRNNDELRWINGMFESMGNARFNFCLCINELWEYEDFKGSESFDLCALLCFFLTFLDDRLNKLSKYSYLLFT